MFRKSLFRITRLCVGGECAPLLQGQRKHMFIQSNDCTHFREVCFKWLSWLSVNCAFQILPDSSTSFNFSHSFYKDFIKYLKIRKTSADSCFQEICTVTTLLDSGKSPGRMTTEWAIKSITISVCDPHGQESVTWSPRKRYRLVHKSWLSWTQTRCLLH